MMSSGDHQNAVYSSPSESIIIHREMVTEMVSHACDLLKANPGGKISIEMGVDGKKVVAHIFMHDRVISIQEYQVSYKDLRERVERNEQELNVVRAHLVELEQRLYSMYNYCVGIVRRYTHETPVPAIVEPEEYMALSD